MCLVASNEQDLQINVNTISGCIKEYGRKINETKSTVVCINGVKKESRSNIDGCEISEIDH